MAFNFVTLKQRILVSHTLSPDGQNHLIVAMFSYTKFVISCIAIHNSHPHLTSLHMEVAEPPLRRHRGLPGCPTSRHLLGCKNRSRLQLMGVWGTFVWMIARHSPSTWKSQRVPAFCFVLFFSAVGFENQAGTE